MAGNIIPAIATTKRHRLWSDRSVGAADPVQVVRQTAECAPASQARRPVEHNPCVRPTRRAAYVWTHAMIFCGPKRALLGDVVKGDGRR
jgi:hypothetical protein